MSFIDILKLLGPILLILGLLYGVLFVVKKYAIPIKGKQSKLFRVDVITTQMLYPKKYVSVIKIKDKLLVLGVSENSINLLKELEYSPEEFESASQENQAPNFLDLLKKNLMKR